MASTKTAAVDIDLALGLEVSRAAKAAGITPREFVEAAVRAALAAKPDARTRQPAIPGL